MSNSSSPINISSDDNNDWSPSKSPIANPYFDYEFVPPPYHYMPDYHNESEEPEEESEPSEDEPESREVEPTPTPVNHSSRKQDIKKESCQFQPYGSPRKPACRKQPIPPATEPSTHNETEHRVILDRMTRYDTRLDKLESEHPKLVSDKFNSIEDHFESMVDDNIRLEGENKRRRTKMDDILKDNDRIFRCAAIQDLLFEELSQRLVTLEKKVERDGAIGEAVAEMSKTVTQISRDHE